MDRHSVEERIRAQQEFAAEMARKHARSRETHRIQVEVSRLQMDMENAEREYNYRKQLYEDSQRQIQTRHRKRMGYDPELGVNMHSAEERLEHQRELLKDAESRFSKHASQYLPYRPNSIDYSDAKRWWGEHHPYDRWLLDEHPQI
jgi:hypothetical protein